MKKFVYGAAVCALTAVILGGCGEKNEAVQKEVDAAGQVEDGLDHHDVSFEWSGEFELEEGQYTLTFHENAGGDEHVKIVFIEDDGSIQDLDHHAAHIMEADAEQVKADGTFTAESEYAYELALNTDQTVFTFNLEQAGKYTVFTEHHPNELGLKVTNSEGQEIPAENEKEYDAHDHEH